MSVVVRQPAPLLLQLAATAATASSLTRCEMPYDKRTSTTSAAVNEYESPPPQPRGSPVGVHRAAPFYCWVYPHPQAWQASRQRGGSVEALPRWALELQAAAARRAASWRHSTWIDVSMAYHPSVIARYDDVINASHEHQSKKPQQHDDGFARQGPNEEPSEAHRHRGHLPHLPVLTFLDGALTLLPGEQLTRVVVPYLEFVYPITAVHGTHQLVSLLQQDTTVAKINGDEERVKAATLDRWNSGGSQSYRNGGGGGGRDMRVGVDDGSQRRPPHLMFRRNRWCVEEEPSRCAALTALSLRLPLVAANPLPGGAPADGGSHSVPGEGYALCRFWLKASGALPWAIRTAHQPQLLRYELPSYFAHVDQLDMARCASSIKTSLSRYAITGPFWSDTGQRVALLPGRKSAAAPGANNLALPSSCAVLAPGKPQLTFVEAMRAVAASCKSAGLSFAYHLSSCRCDDDPPARRPGAPRGLSTGLAKPGAGLEDAAGTSVPPRRYTAPIQVTFVLRPLVHSTPAHDESSKQHAAMATPRPPPSLPPPPSSGWGTRPPSLPPPPSGWGGGTSPLPPPPSGWGTRPLPLPPPVASSQSVPHQAAAGDVTTATTFAVASRVAIAFAECFCYRVGSARVRAGAADHDANRSVELDEATAATSRIVAALRIGGVPLSQLTVAYPLPTYAEVAAHQSRSPGAVAWLLLTNNGGTTAAAGASWHPIYLLSGSDDVTTTKKDVVTRTPMGPPVVGTPDPGVLPRTQPVAASSSPPVVAPSLDPAVAVRYVIRVEAPLLGLPRLQPSCWYVTDAIAREMNLQPDAAEYTYARYRTLQHAFDQELVNAVANRMCAAG